MRQSAQLLAAFSLTILCFAWNNRACGDDTTLPTQAVQLLHSKCISCHGPDKMESGLRLDTREFVLKGGDRGPAVVEGNQAESLLLNCVTGLSGEELRMPPKNPLSANEIELLKRWLAHGAAWSESPSVEMLAADNEQLGNAWTDPRNPIVKIFHGERLDLWSLKPISVPVPPDAPPADWRKNEIDSFVAARFATAGIPLPSRADRSTLLRRIHFDLTGLPPTPELVATFDANWSEAEFTSAIEKLMDQLLASNQFGVHWARMWLDVARYSDSNGFDWDEFRPHAYRYRDYVIRSFQQDKPYDQFITEQLAGDELFDGPPRDQSEQDALIATGFLRMGPHDNAAKLFNEQDRSRDELLIDLVETTSGAMLGMTMSCCRCHDHKFDPISQADYFRLRACFAGVKFADELPIDLAEQQLQVEQFNSVIDQRIAKLKSELDDLKKQEDEAHKQRIGELQSAIKDAKKELRKFTLAMLMNDEEKPPATFVLYQGDYKTPRQEVTPGVLSILNPNKLEAVPVARKESSGRRTALARWITSPDNPLTARVFVNRVWMQLMGQGLVRTPGDFGLAGSPPEDPALLDRLAHQFMTEGWSIKRLVRSIMLSATYQQSAMHREPPESLHYATRRPRRLTAEQLRDSMLAVSGLLTPKLSGPPQWPNLPREVLEANPAFLDDNETKTKGWYPSPSADQHCRSIFLVQKRNTRVPLLETLDQPENSVPCQRRLTSIVAPQALSLLNSPEAIQAAKSFAERIKLLEASTTGRIHRAFLLALQRKPTPAEVTACQKLVDQSNWTELCRALINVNEFAYVD